MYRNIKSSIVSKDTMNRFREMFLLARMFPLAVMYTPPPSGRGISFISNLFIILFIFFCSYFNLTSILATSEKYNFFAILSLFFVFLSSFLFLSYFCMKSCLPIIFTYFSKLFEYSIGLCLNDFTVYSDGRMGGSVWILN